MNARDHVLHNAVIGGKDIDGVPIYIGLAEHRRDTLPAHVDPRRKTVHVSWGGKQVSCSRYEVRCMIDVQIVRIKSSVFSF